MSDEFGSDYISLVDEDGNEVELELLDVCDIDGVLFHAFVSADSSPEEDEDLDIIILKSIDVDGEEMLSTPDTDEELEMAYEQFMLRLFETLED